MKFTRSWQIEIFNLGVEPHNFLTVFVITALLWLNIMGQKKRGTTALNS
jgi:hypothetical protein